MKRLKSSGADDEQGGVSTKKVKKAAGEVAAASPAEPETIIRNKEKVDHFSGNTTMQRPHVMP